MRSFYFSCVILLSCIIISGCAGPNPAKYARGPRLVEAKGDYLDRHSGTRFPDTLLGSPRTEIIAFNRDTSNVSASYGALEGMFPRFSIIIYPAKIAYENRLLREYSNAMSDMTTAIGGKPKITHERVAAMKDGVKLLGLRGRITIGDLNSVVVFFECGKYFQKFYISSYALSMEELVRTSDRLIDEFPPLELVKRNPLKKDVIYILPRQYAEDFTCRLPIVASMNKKKAWALTNIDSLELCAGFPSLYFQAHKESIEAMIDAWPKVDTSIVFRESIIKPYIEELRYIRDCDMLDEFIYDSYSQLLFLPEGTILHMDKYRRWKEKRKPKVTIIGTPLYQIFVPTWEE